MELTQIEPTFFAEKEKRGEIFAVYSDFYEPRSEELIRLRQSWSEKLTKKYRDTSSIKELYLSNNMMINSFED